MRGGEVVMSAMLAVAVVAELLLLLSTAVGADDDAGRFPRRRSLHEPFFPIDWSPPPPPSAAAASDGFLVPPSPPSPPTAAAADAAKGGGRSLTGGSLTNAIAIALAAGLVAFAVAAYSCFLLLRRAPDGAVADDAGRAPKSSSARAVDAATVASDVGSGDRRHRSPPAPSSSAASDAIYIDPVATTTTAAVERRESPDLRPIELAKLRSPDLRPIELVRQLSPDLRPIELANQPSPDLRPIELVSQRSPELRPIVLVRHPSPDLRPLPPLKPQAQQHPPPQASTPPMTATDDSSADDEDQDTFYTARKTVMSSFSRSTSQRSTLEQKVLQPPASTPTPTTLTPPPPQANSLRPPRPPAPPPPPRQRLLRPMPAECPPSPALAHIALTNSSEPSDQIRGVENPDGHRGVAPQQNKPPSLKPLHWDKLRAISARTTVWDQFNNSDSFSVDEAAMESLFTNIVGGTANSGQAAGRRGAEKNESRLLDPKRLQNIAIMLKALNVTSDDVIGALVHGNGDLSPEFYEALAKMAPTKEEELTLKDYRGDLLKIDPAERFLKDILDVPFAFKRVDAMLYRANFDTELDNLSKSFETLEAACADLRSSKLFLKLLDAVLKTGNCMNDGTNRGEARAFKLDTLLKLADIKSTDGKTTVLHFVVQELIRSEGLGSNQTGGSGASKEQFKKDGLKLVAELSSELSNVKRAATLEVDSLISGISRLETDLEKVKQVLQLKETCPDQGSSSDNFFDGMDAFLSRALAEIQSVKVAGESALRRVKDTAEYFHGDVANKEEPHHLRIFSVVSDFLATLDRVCGDVGRTPERVMMGSGKSFRITAGTSLPPRRYARRRELSSDEDSSSS